MHALTGPGVLALSFLLQPSTEPQQPSLNQAPYERLFAPAPQAAPTTTPDGASELVREAPSVVCGMTVFKADPAVDPKMIIPLRPDGATPHIRVITPLVCTR